MNRRSDRRQYLMGVGAGGEHRPARPDRSPRRAHLDARAGARHAHDPAALVDLHAEALGFVAQAVHQLHRIEDAATSDLHPAEVERGVELRPQLLPAQEPMAFEPQMLRRGDRAAGIVDLRFGERGDESAGRLVLAVDAAIPQEGDHLLDVGLPQARQPAGFRLAEVLDREAVRVVYGLGQHARVPATGSEGGDLLLQDDDVGGGVELLEEERRPEPGQSGAHDDGVGVAGGFQPNDRPRRTAGQPEAGLLDRNSGHRGLLGHPNKLRYGCYITGLCPPPASRSRPPLRPPAISRRRSPSSRPGSAGATSTRRSSASPARARR